MSDRQLPDVSARVEQLAVQLKARGWCMAAAESCTGGMLASACTAIAGSSEWFEQGVVSYSNQAKSNYLNVSAQLIESHGAVSIAVAEAMALGVCVGDANLSVAITGIAGPSGGNADKPVGTVCFALAGEQGILASSTKHFTGDRHAIRVQSVAFALDELLRISV